METFERLTCPDPIARAWCGILRPWVPKKKAFSRLVFYEDTGLAPEEITTEKPACVFYCNRKCNLDGDWCPEGPGCPKAVDSETVMRWLSPQPDVPLTLAELREMDGEPVWVTVSASWRESGILGGWCLVSYHITDDQVRVYLYNTRSGASFFPQQDYGISWWAYRRKPNALNENVPKLDTMGDQVNCAQVGHQGGQTMRILKPGDPCPCCGQPIKEGLPTETIMLLSWLQEGKDLSATTKGVKDETIDH